MPGATNPLSGLLDPFYISRPYRGDGLFEPGDLVEVPIPYLHAGKRVIDVDMVDPRHEKPPLIRLTIENEETFRHDPVADLDLKHDEALLAIKHKKRPAVVFSGGSDDPRRGRTKSVLCVPIYSLKPEFGDEFVRSVRYMQYRSTFYLPPAEAWPQESFTLFPYTQSLPAKWISDHYARLALDPGALDLMREWFRWYLGEAPTDWVTEVRAELAKLLAQDQG